MKNLTSGNIYKNFILFAIPMVLAALFSQAYNTIDTIIAGKFLGESGIAAVGATSAFITFVSSVFWGFGTGLSVYVAKLFGAEAYRKLRDDIYGNIMLLVAVELLVSGLILLLRKKIYQLLNVDSAVLAETDRYFIIYMAGFFLVSLNSVGAALMNALGSSAFPFGMSVVSAILNIGGNIFSVTVLEWGTAGIGAATILAAGVVDICYFFKLRQGFRRMGIQNLPVHISLRECRSSWEYSLPVCLQQSVMYLASLAMSPIVNGIGAAATAGYTVVLKIYDINAAVYQNSAKTLSNYAAQSVGARKFENLHKGLRVGLMQGVLFVSPFLLASVFWAEPVCTMFFPDGYAGDGLAYAVLFSRCFLPFILLNLLNNLFHAFYRGVGSMRTLLFATAIGSVSRIGASLLLTPGLGMEGIYLGWVISWLMEVLFTLGVYLTKFRTTEMIRGSIESRSQAR